MRLIKIRYNKYGCVWVGVYWVLYWIVKNSCQEPKIFLYFISPIKILRFFQNKYNMNKIM